MNIKKSIIPLVMLSTFSQLSYAAEVTANIGATSNYVWRGTTQTDDSAAIQGGVDFTTKRGYYAGAWTSNIDWGDTTIDNKGTEFDTYFGFARDIKKFNYDVGAIRYIYPSDNHEDSDFTELYAKGGYENFSLGVAYTVEGDPDKDSAFSAGDLYYHAGLNYKLRKDWGLDFTVGYYDFDTKPTDKLDYAHSQIDLTKSAGNLGDFTLSYSRAYDEDNSGYATTFDDNKVFVSWSKTF